MRGEKTSMTNEQADSKDLIKKQVTEHINGSKNLA